MTHIVCPHCQAINRVADEKCTAQSGAICGKCKQSLFTGQVIEADQQSFYRFIEKSDLPVIVDFWAPWCGPCRMFAPTFAQTAQMFAARAVFIKLNTEQWQQVASAFAIRSIPTLMIFKGGKQVQQIAGALPQGQLVQWVSQSV